MNSHLIRRACAAITAGASVALAASATQPQPDPLSPPANGPRKADPSWHAFTNATVHTRPGVALEHATVVLKGDRIVSVEAAPAPKSDGTPTSSPPAPAGARVWDCAGLHIYAGFIDPYVEVDVPAPGPDSPGAHWNTRVTPQRTALDTGGIDAPTAESLRKLGYAAAAISPRGGIFRGTAAVVSLAKADEDLSLARPPVYAENTYQAVALDAGRVGGRRGGGGTPPAVETNTNSNWPGYPDSQMGAIALIRQTLIDADWQAGMRALDPRVHTALDSLRSDLARNAPFGVLAGSTGNSKGAQRLPLLFNTDDELEYARASKIAREFDRPLLILGCGTEFRRLAAIQDDKLPIIIPLNFPEAPKVASIGQAESVELRDLMTWEQAPTNARRLEQAGLDVSLTTSKLRDRAKFRDNLRKAILHGLTEDQALAMVTTRPAALLGVDDRLGTIEPGKVASLVIADGPLFAKKTALRDLWVDGKRHELNAPPPLKLQGEWEVTITPPPKAPEGGGPAPQIFFSIDKDNNITISKRTTGAEGKVETKTSKAREVRIIGSSAPARFSFVFDHDPFGEPGVFTNSGTVEAGEGGALVMHASAVRSAGQMFSWTAQRSPISPIAGAWRLSETDGAAAERGAPTLAISAGPGATVRLRGQEQTVKDVTFADGVLGFAVDGKAFGIEGDSALKLRLEGEFLKGERTDADGAKHTLTFKRDDRPQGGRGAGGGGARGGQAPSASEEADQKEDDGITGTWTGTATPPAPGAPLPFTLTITKAAEGALKGTISSAKGTHDLTGLAYAADTGALSFTIAAPGGPAQNTLTLKDGKLSGTLTVGSSTYTLTGSRAAPDEDEEQPPKDIPETYGYPFGPYALDNVPDQPAWLELRGATIWTEGPAGVIEHGTLIVKDGKVDYVGKPFTGKRPDGAIEIDLAAGTHITPGLIDCHSHTGISRGVNESGQAVTAEVRIQDVTDPDSMSWYWQLAGGLTCVNNLHGSANPMGGQNCVNKIRWGAVHADDLHFQGAMPGIKFALGENVKQSNWGTDSGRYPKTRMGVESLMRERFTAAKEYLEAQRRGGLAPAQGMSAAPVRRDLELEALGEILEGKRLIHCHSYRQDEILMLCRIADDFKFKLGTFQHILEGYKVADEVRDHALGASAFSDWWAYKVEVQDAIPYGGAIMHDQGVCVSFNSDSDELARRMNVEAGKACKYGGLAADEALKFVTINPARQLHIEDRVGSLEAGKDADFAVWTVLVPPDSGGGRDGAGTPAPSASGKGAPPLEASPLSTLAVCQATYVDGRCYFSIEQDKKMREANAANRARVVQKLLTAQNKRPEGARPDGPPGGGDRPFRRRGPGDDLAAGAGPPDEPEPGGRRSLLYDTLKRAADARREYFLELIRRGIDPDTARCGECGESFLGTEVAR